MKNKYYILVETATGNFETYANTRCIELFEDFETASNKMEYLKDAFFKEQYARHSHDYIESNNHLFSVTRQCNDYIYNDTSVYSLEIRSIDNEIRRPRISNTTRKRFI